MDELPRPEEIIDITGPEGESLFWHLKAWLMVGRESELQTHLDQAWDHYRDIEDDRLLSLVAALCIEGSLDALLQAIGSGFGEYREDIDFTFSVKIKTARALRFIPARILTVCDFIRQVRNEFAHHLNCKRFDQLDEDKYLKKLAPYVRAFNRATRDARDYRRLFTDMVGFTLAALKAYSMQVGRLREYLQTDVGRQAFKEWADEH